MIVIVREIGTETGTETEIGMIDEETIVGEMTDEMTAEERRAEETTGGTKRDGKKSDPVTILSVTEMTEEGMRINARKKRLNDLTGSLWTTHACRKRDLPPIGTKRKERSM